MALHDAVSTVSRTSSQPYGQSTSGYGSSSSSGSSVCSSLSMLAVGAAAGVALGMYLSPRSGAIRSAISDYASQGSERLQQLASSSACWAEDTLNRAMSVIEQGRSAFRTSSVPTSQPLSATIGERFSATGRSVDELGAI
jgi:hypothetical protein